MCRSGESNRFLFSELYYGNYSPTANCTREAHRAKRMSPKRPTSLYGCGQSCALKSYRSLNSINKINHSETCRLEEVKLAIKSQFGAEFRRFSIVVGAGIPPPSFEEFTALIHDLHKLTKEQRSTTHITYLSQDGSTLPISNNENLRKALETRERVLRLVVQHKGESLEEQYGYGVAPEALVRKKRKVSISAPQDFRRVSSILDVDILPRELRRVRLCKFYNNKPLGFYIRDGAFMEKHFVVSPLNCRLWSFTNKQQKVKSLQCLEVKLAIKSQFGAEFRRFSIVVGAGIPPPSFEEFTALIHDLHKLTKEQRSTTHITYLSQDGSTLPISNNENLRKALETRERVLRLVVQHKGESLEEQYGYGVAPEALVRKKRKVSISAPQDFRRVSSILDVDILPRELRRVRLCKFYNNKPLGFYIRDGYSERLTPWGFTMAPGIFISRLLPNGLAASTNLLNVNDEIVEVNGIEVSEKTLDQVTDIMIANSANLILTVRPAIPSPYHNLPYLLPPPCALSPVPPAYYSPYGCRPHHDYRDYGIPPGIPPSYCSPQMTQSLWVPSNLTCYGMENQPDVRRTPISQPFHGSSFSRDSTWRISDKLAKMSLRSRDSPKHSDRKKRPLTVHCSAQNVIPTPPYPFYGY
ncbi:PB1 domain protein [Teladorsagia circumcincta]|uniref:PB1 domain protein n=1 Tax=Teladorsagia circumcincta TaxID=45464 RepID=A0A2G9UAH9_TELCI|nr:PB1 domain protein [Teladorsagia circumcincta]